MDDVADLLQIKIDKARAQLPKETREAIDAVEWKATILKMRETKGYSFEQLEDLEIETDLLLAGLISSDNYPKELAIRMKLPRGRVDELVNEMNELVFKKIREEMIKATARKKMMEPIQTAEPISAGKRSDLKGVQGPTLGNAPIPTKTQPVLLNLTEIEPPKSTTPKTEAQVFKNAGIEINQDNPSNLPLSGEATHPPDKGEIGGLESREEMVTKIENVDKPPSILTAKLSGSFQIPSVKTEHTLPGITKTIPAGTGGISPLGKKIDPYRMSPDE